MSYKLFIDDERNPVTDDWIIARNSSQAAEFVLFEGLPSEIAFDHDLGEDDTSIVFINWLINLMLDFKGKFPKDFTYTIHSANPIGASNIKSKMDALIMEVGYVD